MEDLRNPERVTDVTNEIKRIAAEISEREHLLRSLRAELCAVRDNLTPGTLIKLKGIVYVITYCHPGFGEYSSVSAKGRKAKKDGGFGKTVQSLSFWGSPAYEIVGRLSTEEFDIIEKEHRNER